MSNFWLHPALILILGSLLLPVAPARLKKPYLLLVPLLVFVRTLFLNRGIFGEARSWIGRWSLAASMRSA